MKRKAAHWRSVMLGLVVSLSLLMVTPRFAQGDATCQVTIDGGAVEGLLVGQTCKYLGIPYAASPANEGRWRPPAPVVPWKPAVLDATAFGNMCPQLQGTTTVVGKEDCLNLNVFSPPHDAPLPVIVFIHSGGNRSNSNSNPRFDGQYLSEHGSVVVVTINYRLGALGWLAHPSLDAESANAGGTGTSGNYGILDQIAALKWVQKNIAAFGGDPSRVMITGHSAGTNDSAVLLASPLAKGLFARVLLDGGDLIFVQFDSPTLPAYEARLETYVVEPLGCAHVADIPACLRAVPASTIVKTAPGVGGIFNGPTYRETIDGVVLNENVLQTAKEGAQNRVPLIIGGGARETADPVAFIALTAIPTETAYEAAVHQLFDPLFGQAVGDMILAFFYPSASYPTPRDAFIAVTTDYRFLCPARQLARAVSNSQKEPVYRFVFTHALSSPPVVNARGAYHGEEVVFIFHTFAFPGGFGPFTPTGAELNLSDQMIGYWSRFAATGNPNGDRALVWPVYGQNADNQGRGNTFFTPKPQGDDKKDTFLQFDTPLAVGAGFHAFACENLWDQLVGDTNNGHGVGSMTNTENREDHL